MNRELLYVADPMCSWCWGFSPTIHNIAKLIDGEAKLTPIMGGLRPLTREPMSETVKLEVQHHWESVAQRSGQEFDMSFFDRNDFVYDTEPACRAVCVVRRIEADRALDYMHAIQQAFYVENRDVTNTDELTDIADGVGIDPDLFRPLFLDVISAYETAGDFQTARQLGVTGYPTIVLRTENEFAMLNAGYQDFEELKQPLEDWISGDMIFGQGDEEEDYEDE